MDKVELLNKVISDIRELRQRLVMQDMDLVGLDIRIVETGEIMPVKYNPRNS